MGGSGSRGRRPKSKMRAVRKPALFHSCHGLARHSSRTSVHPPWGDDLDAPRRYCAPTMIRRPLAQRVGRFRLLEELGRGGMGVVYRATDPATGSMIALKVLLAADHAGDEATRRFQREAETARLVDHPNVVKVHELGWHEGKPFFTMDLVEGGSLEDLRATVRDPHRYAAVMAGVARGLHAAHQRGLAHRDVKPANILMEGETPRLTDFGLARELSGVGQRLTATGEVLGTPAYMAPEQAGNDDYDPALGDQYSVGAVLYDVLSGHPPHDGDNAVAVMMSLASQAHRPLRSVAPDVPVELVRVVEQALSRDPGCRYPDCAALADDLERFAAGMPVQASGPGWRPRLDQALGRLAPILAVGLPLAAVVAAAAGASATWEAVMEERAALDRELHAGRELMTLEAEVDARALDAPQAAVTLLHGFADRHRGTHAVARAVIRHGPELAAHAPDEALALLAAVYSSSTDPADQDQVLDALAQVMEQRWDWPGLAAVTATQLRRHPLWGPSPSIAGPGARVDLAQGSLVRAATAFDQLDDPAAAGVARALTERRAAAADVRLGRAADWDGDGTPELARRDGDDLVVFSLSQDLPERGRLRLPVVGDERVLLLDGTERQLVRWSDGRLQLWRQGDGGVFTMVTDRTTSPVLSAAAADLDGDGADEVYVGLGPYERRLLVAEAGEPFEDAHRGTTGAHSDVVQLLAVDAASGPQLWAAVGPWAAYDVRRFGVHGGELSLLDRRRLGYVSQLLPLADGRVAALHSAEYPSRTAFADDEPFGAPAGIYLLDPADPSAVEVLHWPFPPAMLRGLHEGDLDGDGRPDLLLSAARGAERTLLVYLATDDGYRAPLAHTGLEVVWTGQLDGDAPVELLAVDGRDPSVETPVWVGAGGEAVVALPTDVVPPQPAPPDLDAVHAAAWQRADDLVAMGLYRPAALAFQRLAPTLPKALAPTALARAARLLEAEGRLDEAAEVWTQLVGRHPEARAAAAADLRATHRFGRAAAVGGPAAPTGDTTWHLVAGREHADALTVIDPVGATPGEGLALAAVSGEGPLAGVKLPWNGDHFATEITLDLDHLEWGSGVVLELDGWSEAALAIRAWGGGGMYERTAECPGVGGTRVTLPSTSVRLDERWVLRLDWHDGELLCQITAPDGSHSVATRRAPPPPVGDLVWTLRPARHAPNSSALARGTVSAWTVTATHPQPRLSALPPSEVVTSVAHDLRIRPALAVPELVASLGTGALVPFRDVHAALQHSHPHDPVTQRVYTVHAAPLLATSPHDLAPEEASAYADLLARRGMAWLDLRELEAARADLGAAYALLDDGAPLPLAVDDPDWPLRVDVSLALAASWADQAPETARRHARHALQLHPVPELAADRIRAHPILRDLEGLWP